MKRQIRRGVFETNSSSQHSLCIMKNNSHYTSNEILKEFCLWDDKETGEEDCIWHVDDDDLEFGRSPFRALGTFYDKWLYACASLVLEYKVAWGIDTIEYWENDRGYFCFERPYVGYVDEDMLSGFLKREKVSLEEYLTNKKYIVIQDGDETCYWSDMKNLRLVNMDVIDHEYPVNNGTED